MTTFLNKHRMITAQAVASATLIGLVSVSVAKPLHTVSATPSCQRAEYEIQVNEIVQPLNTDVVLNSIGYRVPVAYYK